MDNADKLVNFKYNKAVAQRKLIKVIGVGGAGGNAVKHIHASGLQGVSYLLLNTDEQDLAKSGLKDVAVIGQKLTQGLGAGSKIEVGEEAALEDRELIHSLLDDNETQMVFICAGMGGGTGTGAAPVIAKIARDMGLLTVGFIFMPFVREERQRMIKAAQGAERMRQEVDSLVIIANENINQVYGELPWNESLNKANEILANAVRAITMVITNEMEMNQDFADVRTTLKDGGIAHISIGYGEGVDRVSKAIDSALRSPLLNNDDITTATRLQLAIFYDPSDALTTDEMDEIKKLTSSIRNLQNNKSGHAFNEELGNKVMVVIIASGFQKEAHMPMTAMDVEDYVRQTEIEKEQNKLLNQYYSEFDLEPRSSLPTFVPIVLTDDELDRDDLIDYLDEEPAKNHSYSEVEERRAKYKYGNQTPAMSQTLDTSKVAQRSTPTRMPSADVEELPNIDPTKEGTEPTTQPVNQPKIIKF
ncbi:cell division protein FtsZ [uncultured Porphyromonas sp.]|uniref:cell division protein FtsZ n=1 Tax=uncultured Porphyromonas sp. TaxID=159274 RepID=UPI002620CE07|nr:cell division protein FtsZ [uncultured Porphyromonas sp.]